MAISQTRPSVVVATVAIARWRLPAASSALARAAGEHLDAALDEPGHGAGGEAEHGQSAEQENRERGGEDHEVDVLGRGHKMRPSLLGGRTRDYIRKGRRTAF